MRNREILTDFSAGEISPRMAGRADWPLFRKSCTKIQNMLVLPQGGVTMRTGSLHSASAIPKGAGGQYRAVRFDIEGVSYGVEFGDKKLRIHQNLAYTGTELVSPWSDSELRDLQWITVERTMYLLHGSHQVRKLAVDSGGTWTLTEVSWVGAPEYSVPGGGGGATPSEQDLAFGGTWVDGDSFILSSAEGATAPIFWIGESLTLRSRIQSALTVLYVNPELGLSGGIEVTGNYPNYTVEFTGEYAGFREFIQATVTSGSGTLGVSGDPGSGSSLAPVWSAANGYPRTGCVFDQRLWLGGVEAYPQTVWGSVVGALETFTLGPDPDDGISWRIWSREAMAIRWMAATTQLCIGTTAGDFVGFAGEEGIAPESPLVFRRQTAYRSSFVRPLEVGSELVYAELGGRKLRTFLYDWGERSWQSRELTYFAQHISNSSNSENFVELAYSNLCDPIIWALRGDGWLMGLTYQREFEISAWHRHAFNGKVLAMCTQILGDTEGLMLIVERGSDVTVEWVRDCAPQYFERDPEDNLVEDPLHSYLNASVVYDNVSTTLTGLGHLEGQSVLAVVDGVVEGPFTVNSGQIEVSQASTRSYAGLAYQGEFTTSPLHAGVGSVDWGEVILRLFESTLPLVNGRRPAERSPDTPMDTADPLFSGDVPVNMSERNGGTLTVTQDQPLPCTVTGIHGMVETQRG